MQTYIAFLRGINVGGHSLIKMTELVDVLAKSGLENVKTYIQSGNVIFDSDTTDTTKLVKLVNKVIRDNFKHEVDVAIYTSDAWQKVTKDAPKWWGEDPAWRHYIFIIIEPYDMKEVMATIGELKPGMELLEAGNGVLYQSVDFPMIGRATTGSKFASNPVYKRITMRNFNTATKLSAILASIEK